MNISANAYGVKLLQSAQTRYQNAASEIESFSSANKSNSNEPDSLTKSMIELKKAVTESSAAAEVIEADKKMLGTILDIKA